MFGYSISVIDNRDKAEVMTMRRRGIDEQIVKKLMESIEANTR
ncbi:MAG: hypothetical protein R3F29_14360 [Planctomycetota bacterium]